MRLHGYILLLAGLLASPFARAETRAAAPARRAAPGAASAAKPAAPVEPPINMAAVLTRTYEEKARETLERFLPIREFQVAATVQPSGKVLPRAPYEPRALGASSILNMTPEELDPYVARISLEVLVSTRLKNATRRIEELLFKGLGLKRSRDRVTFGNLGIEIETDEWRKEKTDLKREMEILKSENQRLTQELATKKDKADTGAKSSGDDENDIKKQPWFYPALVGGACAILLLGMLVIGGGFFSAGRKLGNAITNVAASMERIGGAISNTSPNAAGGGIQSLEAKLLSEAGGKNGGLASLPMEAIHAHLLKLRHEILEALTDGTESIILRHLTQLLAKPETTGRAVVTLELLGRDTATEMFRRLGVKAQEAVMVFLRTGIYAGNKIEMMLEAAEELKTKLLVESLDSVSGKPSEKVAQRLIQLSDDELAQVALDLEPEYIPRLFLYLDPKRIAALITTIKRLNPDKFAPVLEVLPKLPEARTNDEYDDYIIVAMDSVLDRIKNDFQRPFLSVYQDIVESTEEEISEQIVRELSQDPRLDEYFRANVITVHTFFLLPAEQRNEIMESLSNKDIAALAAGSKPEEQQMLLEAVPERRKSLVAEEFESLTSRGGRQAQYAYKRVREIIVKRLREMKNEGTLVTARGDEGASSASSGGGGGGVGSRRRKKSEESAEAPAEAVAEAPAEGEAPAEEEVVVETPMDETPAEEAVAEEPQISSEPQLTEDEPGSMTDTEVERPKRGKKAA